MIISKEPLIVTKRNLGLGTRIRVEDPSGYAGFPLGANAQRIQVRFPLDLKKAIFLLLFLPQDEDVSETVSPCLPA